MTAVVLVSAMFLIALAACWAAGRGAGDSYANSLGMEMLPIPAGRFVMGETRRTPLRLGGSAYFPRGDYDEQPAHKVKISRAFHMSRTPVTVEQFRRCRPDWSPEGRYVINISWHEAAAFCDWLGRKEGKPYRLPTEAEWEYACRAGTRGLFHSGPRPPEADEPNAWGLVGMHHPPPEWCLNWHDLYRPQDQTDPVGPDGGFCKVVRGGGIQEATPYYARSANRGGLAPDFPPPLPPGSEFDLRRQARRRQPRWNLLDPPKVGEGLIGLWYDAVQLGVNKRGETVTKVVKAAMHRDRLPALQGDWTGSRKPQWSGRWTGYLRGPSGTGAVTFTARTEGLAVLKIDGRDVLRTGRGGGGASGTAELKAGAAHWIALEFTVPAGKGGALELVWNRPGQAPAPVPAEALFHTRYDLDEIAEAEGTGEAEGHFVGFRVVQAEMPQTRTYPRNTPLVQQCVRGGTEAVSVAPPASRPHFRVRCMLPVPPENQPVGAAAMVGMHPGILGHNHSPGLAVCPNGDVLAVHFTACSTSSEYLPNVAFIATRLRYGADRWEFPDFFLDFPDVTEESALLWNDGATLHLFTGGVGLNGTPFKWCSSRDSGSTWDPVKFPVFAGVVGPYSPQPISSAFRDPGGTIYVASDGEGANSVLWASRDDGRTWFDTGGRSAGRHTVYAPLADGSILGIGGKKTHLEGWMPQAISHDGGKTWQTGRTPFPALAGNQRPSLVRLASGRLFFAGDFQSKANTQPAGVTQRGAFVALSEDEGKTWHIKPLPGARPHEGNVLPARRGWGRAAHSDPTLGYSVATQGPNGLVHLISTMNHPCLHFELNEAWILDEAAGMDQDQPVSVPQVQHFEETHPNGRTRCTYGGGVATDGRWLLEGIETWFYQDGREQYEVTWRAGRKVGQETYWDTDGQVRWQWEHHGDGSGVWTQYWPTGQMRSQSTWRDGMCQGTATLWDPTGGVVSKRQFRDGMLVD
ncbi:MAG: SUMF1/EgtB/PvdO family nonheme iron enzyme [Phycisphaerae bacterium]|nr:SUMF1/EgtB/PvdO family nonheme iron enzyme [Phycisphaerae bacterium]